MNSIPNDGRGEMNRADLTAIVDALLQLQENEVETTSIQSLLERVPDRLELFSTRLEDFKTRIAESETRMSDLQKGYRQHEVEIQSILARIEKSNEKLKTVKTNKEYQAGLHEIEDLNRLQSDVEDKMLECLEEIDEAESAAESERESFGTFSIQIEDEKVQLERESEEMQQKLRELLHQRELIVAAIDSGLLKKYEQVKEYTGAIAVAEVKASICQGCHMNIPPQMYNELQRFDRLLNCPHCERIIYPHGSLEND